MALVAGRDRAQPWEHAGRGCFPWDKHNTAKPSRAGRAQSCRARPVPELSCPHECRAGPGCAPGQPEKPSKSCIGV